MKAVMFDLDDTLVYVKDGYPKESLSYAFKQLGLPYTSEDVRKLWFEGQRDQFLTERFGLSKTEDFWKVFVAYDAEHRKANTAVFLDADVVKILRNKEFKIGIVTSANRRAAEAEISLLGRENFDSVVCAAVTQGIQPKPHPQCLEVCMRELRVKKSETCYVGNDSVDMITARNAGVIGIRLNRTGQPIEGDLSSIRINSLYELRYLR